ncbi:MAG: putative surface-anchored protein [Haloplasmataceae bacterium]|nr:putative surface-anchored protein [Haloplasmataceae bacterium]
MRKILMSVTALVLFLFISTAAVNAAEAPAACTVDQKTLVFHYLRFDQNYEKVGIHLWNTGGTGDTVLKSGVDDFGAYINICIGTISPTEGKYSIGSVPLYDATAGDNRWATKDTLDDKDLMIDVTYLFTPATVGGSDTPAEMHVYFLQGSDSVYQPNPTLNNMLILYADSEVKYEGWGIHTWNTGTDGSTASWPEPVLSVDTGYTDKKFPVQLYVLKIADNAEAEIGFILHKGDAKAWGSDILLPTANVKANGTEVLYYIYNTEAPTTKENFTQLLNTYVTEQFDFKPFNNEEDKLTGTYAPDPTVINVLFNQDVKIKVDEVVEFNPNFFTLKQGDTEIAIEVNYLQNKTAVTEFVISFVEENFKLDSTKVYTLSFDNGKSGSEEQKAEIEVDMDVVKPTITLVGETVIEIDQYDEFEFPDFVATDDRDGIITKRVYVPEGKGILDTGKAENQILTLFVTDDWGNETKLDITVKIIPAQVDDIDDKDKDDEKDDNTALIIGVIVGVVALVGAAGVVVLRKKA